MSLLYSAARITFIVGLLFVTTQLSAGPVLSGTYHCRSEDGRNLGTVTFSRTGKMIHRLAVNDEWPYKIKNGKVYAEMMPNAWMAQWTIVDARTLRSIGNTPPVTVCRK